MKIPSAAQCNAVTPLVKRHRPPRCSLEPFFIPSALLRQSSWDHVDALLHQVAPDFADGCISSWLSSGEGLIWEVRDPNDAETGPD
jgi:hypothetical protein